MFGRFFRKQDAGHAARDAWWREANAIAATATPDAVSSIEAVASKVAPEAAAPDEHELQIEMIEGLMQLRTMVGLAALPTVETQHRVIGADRCHFLVPASIPGLDASGKVFLTEHRMVFASGGAPIVWPWHRVRGVERDERDLILLIVGGDAVTIRCNSFGDAMTSRHIALQLIPHAH